MCTTLLSLATTNIEGVASRAVNNFYAQQLASKSTRIKQLSDILARKQKTILATRGTVNTLRNQLAKVRQDRQSWIGAQRSTQAQLTAARQAGAASQASLQAQLAQARQVSAISQKTAQAMKDAFSAALSSIINNMAQEVAAVASRVATKTDATSTEMSKAQELTALAQQVSTLTQTLARQTVVAPEVLKAELATMTQKVETLYNLVNQASTTIPEFKPVVVEVEKQIPAIDQSVKTITQDITEATEEQLQDAQNKAEEAVATPEAPQADTSVQPEEATKPVLEVVNEIATQLEQLEKKVEVIEKTPELQPNEHNALVLYQGALSNAVQALKAAAQEQLPSTEDFTEAVSNTQVVVEQANQALDASAAVVKESPADAAVVLFPITEATQTVAQLFEKLTASTPVQAGLKLNIIGFGRKLDPISAAIAQILSSELSSKVHINENDVNTLKESAKILENPQTDPLAVCEAGCAKQALRPEFGPEWQAQCSAACQGKTVQSPEEAQEASQVDTTAVQTETTEEVKAPQATPVSTQSTSTNQPITKLAPIGSLFNSPKIVEKPQPQVNPLAACEAGCAKQASRPGFGPEWQAQCSAACQSK